MSTALIERVKTEEIKYLTPINIRELQKMQSKGNEHLIEYIITHIVAYRRDSEAKGLYVDNQLVGIILTADYDNLCIKTDIPKGMEYIKPIECAIIEIVVVDDRYKCKGYGRKLIKYESDRLKNDGKKLLYADMSCEEVFGFYKRIGFNRVYNYLVTKKL